MALPKAHLETTETLAEPIGIALRPGDTQLANLLENDLTALRLDGSLDEIYDFWLGDASWLGRASRSAGGAI